MTNLFPCLIFSGPTPIVGSNSIQVVSSHVDPPMEICNDSPTIDLYGFSQRCAQSNIVQLESRQFENAVIGSRQTFPNVAEFRDTVYLMSLAYRFRYSFKRNNPKHMTEVCTIDECPWKVTTCALRGFKIIQVHTFRNVHNHSLEDVTSSQPLMRSKHASLVIDNVKRSSPNY